jgi:hypothetical protein
MRKLGGLFCALIAATLTLHVLGANALAVDTMADWVGENTNASNRTFQTVTTNNNYGLISDTSVGGIVQSKINFISPRDPIVQAAADNGNPTANDLPWIYFADQDLEGTLDFTSSLHMEGTITFNSPTETEPNFCFCWYSSENTAHRIGLGISNLTDAQNPPAGDGIGAVANKLRIDFGYAASGGNRFFNVSADGTSTQSPTNSLLPNGSYPFEFDYVPGAAGQPGGEMHVTVGDFFSDIVPLTTQPWDLDFFELDRFGIVQRATANVLQNPTNTYNVVFSDVTYTGGTAFVPPAVPGDYNGNGKVDGADYVLWRKGGPLANEVDNPGTVDAADYTEWRARYGNPPGAGSGLGAGAVPEPTSALLALVACLATIASWRSRP